MNSAGKSLQFAVCVVLFALLMAFPMAAHSKDKIIIGQAASLSGPLGPSHGFVSAPYYDFWIKDVNAKGGIYVKDYGKKLSRSSKSEAEHVTANTIYYAAIAGALFFHKKRITKFSYKDLGHSFSLIGKQKWIPEDLRELFKKASKYCLNKKGSDTLNA